MTISTTTARVSYTGDGSTTAFAVPFYFLIEADLYVYQDGTLKTLTTHYTITGEGDPAGGTVTFVTAPALGDEVVIVRDPAITQETDYTPNDPFPANTHERALDRLTMISQRNRDLIDRSFTLPDSYSGSASTVIPEPEAGKIVAWNSTATELENIDPSTLASIVAYGTANADKFSGDGVAVSFTLSDNPGALNNLNVSISGVTQTPGADYTWTSGTTLTFTSAPPAGTDNILVRYMQGLPSGITVAQGVTYSPNGAGAVDTTVEEKLHESVSVKDFGAAGDGVTNDASAIQAALNSGAGHIYFPDGNYVVSSDLTLPTTSCRITFSRKAIILAGANNVKVFKSTVSAYLTVIEAPRISGNGKTGVTAFELVHFDSGSVIRDAYITGCNTGIYFKQLCVGGVIENPIITSTANPITIIDGSNEAVVINPQIDNDGANGAGTTAGIAIAGGPTYDTTSVRVIDGYVQKFKYGVTDTSTFGTNIRGTYFETCATADVLLTSSICPIVDSTQHYSSTGVVAIKGASTAGARVLNTIMGSSGRSTGLLDFDGTNTGAKYDFLNTGGASLNLPLGVTTGIAPIDLKADFASGVALTFATPGNLSVSYSTKTATYVRQGNLVFFTIAIVTSAFTHTTASGALQVTGLPFTATAEAHIAPCTMSGWTKAGVSGIVAATNASSTTLQFFTAGTAASVAALSATDVPTGGTVSIYVSGTYIAA